MRNKSQGLIILCGALFFILTFVAGERRDIIRTVVSTGASKGLPNVAYDPLTNRYLVVWQEWTGRDADDWDICGRILDREGEPLGGIIDLASTGKSEKHPKVAASGSGFWTVVWSTGSAIEACSVGPNGGADSRRALTTTSMGILAHPDICGSAGDGGYLVVWEETEAPGLPKVMGTWVGQFSDTRPAVMTIGGSRHYGLRRPSVDAVNGRYLVVWEKHASGTRVDIEGKFIDGGSLTGEEGLGDTLAIANDGAVNTVPSIVGIPDSGSFVAVWSRRAGQGTADIRYAHLDATGYVRSGNVTETGDRSESQPSVAYFGPGGHVLVTYRSQPSGRTEQPGIFARALEHGSSPASAEVLIDEGLTRSGHPSTAWATGEQGRGLIVWDTDEGAGTSLFSREWLAADLPGEPPVVAIISPIDGQEVSKTVHVQVSVEGSTSVGRVEFYIDGEKLGQDSEAPFSLNWETADVPNGLHTIQATATDGSGQTGEDQISVVVRNTIIALDDVTISGTVTFEGAGQANVLMAGFPGDPRTDATGAYSAAVPSGWSGTVTPTLPGFVFNPASRTYSDVSGDLAAEDYTVSFVGGVDDAYEDNDDFASAAVIPIGTIQGLVLNDEDWFKFYVPAEDVGKDLKVRVWGTAFPDTTTRRDLDFYVLDGAGTALSLNMSGSADETTYICDIAEGWYYIAHTYIGIEGTVYSLTVEANDDFGLGYVTGTVRDDEGYVIPGVSVELYGMPFNWDISRPLIYTDSSGRYKIGYTPGPYTVQFNITVNNDDLDWTPDANYLGEVYNGGEVLNVVAGGTVSNIDGQLTPGGVISGRITDASGNPLNMALAYAYAGDTVRASYDYTDMNGYYTMRRLRTGNYAVRFRAPGGVALATEWFMEGSSFASALPVPVTAGQTTANVNGTLIEGGCIAGRVTNSLGDPIEGVQVTAYENAGIALQASSTNSTGDYFIGRLPEGTYRVQFNASTSGDPMAASEYYPDKRLLNDAEGVTVAVGQTTPDINAQLAMGGLIRGRVTDPLGNGLIGISVVCFDTDSDFYLAVSTDSSGDYMLRNLQADQYKVRFRPSPGLWATEWWDGKASFSASDAVTVNPGESVFDIDAELADEFGTITGRVTDGFGAGIEGVTVVAQDAAKAAAYSTAVTNSDGYYSLVSLPTCQAKVQFNADVAYLNYVSEYYNDQGDHGSADAIAVTAGLTTSGIDAVLAARPALAVITSSLASGEFAVSYSGSLEAAGGRTFYHWSVVSGALPEGLTMNARGEISGTPTVQGTFPFTVRVTDSTSPQQTSTQELSITVGAYTGLGYTISGTVTSEGAPLAGVALGGLPGSPVTNSTGGYAAVVPSAWSGTVTPTLAGYAFEPPVRAYANISSSSVGQDYAASPGYRIAGTVTLDGSGLSGAVMSGLPGEPGTDSAGGYEMAVPAGWSGTVTPTLPGFTFSPVDRTYAEIGADATAEDYVSTFAGGVDDAYEDNDDFASAAVVPLGTTSGLVLRDEDWFKFYVPAEDAGKDLKVRVWGTSYPDTTSRRDLDFYVLDGAGTALSLNISASGDETAYICDVTEGWYYIAQTYIGIEGTVYSLTVEANDDFGLGYVTGTVRDDEGYVIPGVSVELYGWPFNWDISRPLIYTDSSGRYKIGYAPGTYTVQFNISVSNDDLDWTPDANYLGEVYNGGEVLTLAAGGTVSDIDGQLTPGGVISGRITDASGNPLNMARAYAYAGDTVRASYDYTDMNGYYTMRQLRTGNYAVRFRAPGGVALATEWFMEGSSFASALPVSVTAGQTTANVNGTLIEGGCIAGRVTNSLGDPLEGVQVTAYDQAGIALQASSTNSTGDYFIEQLPDGTYRVYFNASTADAMSASEYYPDKRLLNEAEGVTVAAGQTTADIDAQLSMGGLIMGRVTDPLGNGLIGISVVCFDADSDFYLAVSTNSLGDYMLKSLQADQYKVRFRFSPGIWATEWWDGKASFSASDAVTVNPGESVIDIDAELADEFGTITGRVTDEFGAGIGGLMVVAHDTAKAAAYSTAVTNSEGYYSLLSLPTCQAKVQFNADVAYLNYVSEYYNDQGDHGSADAIAVTAGSTTSGIDAVLAARPALAVITSSLASGEFAVSYSGSLEAAGGRTFYHWSVVSGALPEGLTMNARGEISGTPTVQGAFPFTVRVTDSTSPQQTSTQELSITVGAYTGLGYTISGTVTSEGAPLAGVALGGLPENTVTNSAGGYAAVVPPEWSGTVTPTLEGFYFTPANRSYSNVNVSQADQDYLATEGIQPTIAVISPNGEESWAAGSSQNVTWTAAGLTGTVTIDLYKGGVYQKMLGTADVSAGTFPWTISMGELAGNDYRVLVWQGGTSDESDGNFTIVRTIRVDFNNDGQEDILWRYYGTGGRNRVWYLGNTDPGTQPLLILDSQMEESVSAVRRKGRSSRPEFMDPGMRKVSRRSGFMVKDPKEAVDPNNWQETPKPLGADSRQPGALIPEMDALPLRPGVADPEHAMSVADPAGASGGQTEIMATTGVLSGADILAVPDLTWHARGTGDFNNDGKTDVLWRYNGTGGRVRVWYMDGTSVIAGADIGSVSDLDWRIVGTGDFNSDGHVDLLWHHGVSGRVRVWYLDGISIIAGADISTVSDLNWKVMGTGDFNSDGHVDILWRHSVSGRDRVWFMDGLTILSGADLIAVTDQNWQIAGTGDYNGDGHIDVIWRYNGSGGYVYIWYLNGTSWIGTEKLTSVTDLNWKIVSR